MRRTVVLSSVLSLGALTVLVASCGKSKKSSDAPSNGGQVPLSSLTVESMKMSKALGFKMPAALKSLGQSATALNFNATSGKKSMEACRTAEQVSQLVQMFEGVSEMFCHLEAESANIQFGKKYEITITGEGEGDEKFGLWIDNSVADKLTVYQCRNNKVTQRIVIDSATAAGAKGSMLMKDSFSEGPESMEFALDFTFDFTDANQQEMASKFSMSMPQMSNTSDVRVTLVKDGVSKFSTAVKGSMSMPGSLASMDFSLRGLLKHNGTQGQSMLKGSFPGPVSMSSKSTFNADGYLVDNSTAAANIQVQASELPTYLASGFAVTEPTGWDCQTTETLTVRMDGGSTAAAHQACSVAKDNVSYDGCAGSDYDDGEMEVIAD